MLLGKERNGLQGWKQSRYDFFLLEINYHLFCRCEVLEGILVAVCTLFSFSVLFLQTVVQCSGFDSLLVISFETV
jgi:hypothetical protein